MVSYLFRMPSGIAGEIVSSEGAYIEPQEVTPFGQTGAPTAYGCSLLIDATTGLARKVNNTDTGIYGILVRPYPTNAGQDGLGVATPPARGAVDVARRGKINVLLSGLTAAVKGGIVYVWKDADAGADIQGGFVAANPGGSGFAIPATFDGPADTDGIVSISFNI